MFSSNGQDVSDASDCYFSSCSNWEVCVDQAAIATCLAHVDDVRLGSADPEAQGDPAQDGGSGSAVVIIFVLFGLITALAVGYAIKCYCCPKNRR